VTRVDPLPEELAGKKAADMTPEELERLFAWIRAAYDSEIGYVDEQIGRLFERLRLEEAIVLFLSDHGEEFYEHGDLTHGQNLYAETARVPLLLRLPNGAASGRVTAPVSTLDVVPTLRRLLELPAVEQDQGRDLLAAASDRPIHGLLEGKSGQHPLDEDLRSIVVDGRRLIEWGDGRVELFDIARDPGEKEDIAAERPELVSDLLLRLEDLERSAPPYPRATCDPRLVNDALRERLKAIGYLGEDPD
jgi:arylsulfatase A-like enzyme